MAYITQAHKPRVAVRGKIAPPIRSVTVSGGGGSAPPTTGQIWPRGRK